MAYHQEEYDIQYRVVLILKFQYPHIVFTSLLGGIKTTIGQAVKLKKLGYRRGAPDLLILEPVGKYHGLSIEIKTALGEIRPEQIDWADRLNAKGYCARITRGYAETLFTIEEYLAGRII